MLSAIALFLPASRSLHRKRINSGNIPHCRGAYGNISSSRSLIRLQRQGHHTQPAGRHKRGAAPAAAHIPQAETADEGRGRNLTDSGDRHVPLTGAEGKAGGEARAAKGLVAPLCWAWRLLLPARALPGLVLALGREGGHVLGVLGPEGEAGMGNWLRAMMLRPPTPYLLSRNTGY